MVGVMEQGLGNEGQGTKSTRANTRTRASKKTRASTRTRANLNAGHDAIEQAMNDLKSCHGHMRRG